MNINPGDLNKRITIYKPSSERDSDGYAIGHPILVHRCWARFSRESGTEHLKSDGSFSHIKVRFLIRYTKIPLQQDMTVTYNGKIYEIKYINNYGDSNEYIEIIAEEVRSERGSL